MKDLSKQRDLNNMVDKAMNILDEDFQVPENLVDQILRNRSKNSKQARSKRISYSFVTQIAAVLAIGVFLGIVLGKNADSKVFLSKEDKKHQSMMDYKESHHLTVDFDHIMFLHKHKIKRNK